MYGQIHVIIRSLVTSKFGEEAWKKIEQTAAVDEDEHFLVFNYYDDAMALKLIGAAAEALGVSIEVVLDAFGDYFITYCLEHGYDKMLRTLGDSFENFIQNLDSLHAILRMSYTQMQAPSFRCIKESEGVYILHYYSGRIGLHAIISGMMRAVGREFYGVRLETEIIEVLKEELDGGDQAHVIFRVTERGAWDEKEPSSAVQSETRTPAASQPAFIIPRETIVDVSCFCEVFPFHVIVDRKMIIRQCGLKLQNMVGVDRCVGDDVNNHFTILHPPVSFDFRKIKEFINASYVIKVNINRVKGPDVPESASNIILKGQMICLSNDNHILFIGSPRLSSLTDMMERKLYLSDIPLYDVTRELVLLNQQRMAEIEISKKLDETTVNLKRTSRLLDIEKKKTDALLFQMLPMKVANLLRDGKKVDAEKFEICTILFSDIVTFTNIAAAVQPMDIVNMLNDLYSRFDALTNVNNVYKVETIGDAYMVVGGVPEVNNTHAQDVANQGLGMVIKAAEVKSPATGLALQIRVGIHSGPVVSGVVGDKMPRFCLFGDTVNTASRMESHGIPGRIHISSSTYECLKGTKFKFKPRGPTQIKGKGLMRTHFLYTNGESMAIESEDDPSPIPENPETDEVIKDDNLKDDFCNTEETESPKIQKLNGFNAKDSNYVNSKMCNIL